MAENRHRFPLYLHFAIGTLSVILGCFGILGYVVYGEEVNQIVTESFPTGILIQVVRCLLCFAILLTYPLQIFPVIEIVEGWLFSSECNTVQEDSNGESNSELSGDNPTCQSMSSRPSFGSASESSRLLAPEIPKQKSIVSEKVLLYLRGAAYKESPAQQLGPEDFPVGLVDLSLTWARNILVSKCVRPWRKAFLG